MAAFYIEVAGKQYELEYTREAFAQFERMGFSINEFNDPHPYTVGPVLLYVGLRTHDMSMNPNLAGKIFDTAVDEFGVKEVYESLATEFLTAFTAEGGNRNKKSNKSLIVKPNMVKTTAKSID